MKYRIIPENIVRLTPSISELELKDSEGIDIVIPVSEEDDYIAFYEKYIADNNISHKKVLLKNYTRDINGHRVRGFCCDAYDVENAINELADRNPDIRFGFCLDLKVVDECAQSIWEFVESVIDFTDVIIWPSENYRYINQLICILKIHEYKGIIIFDMNKEMSGLPILLRDSIIKKTNEIINYIEFQINMELLPAKYEKIVLFGAGQMCINYMRAFGKVNKPLFTCDNNSGLWGQKIEGIEIKSPEALLDLSEDTVVVICNMYYREIEKQLKEMGLKNKIELYSDECVLIG